MLLLVVVAVFANFGISFGYTVFLFVVVKSFTGERSGVQARETDVVLQQGCLH